MLSREDEPLTSAGIEGKKTYHKLYIWHWLVAYSVIEEELGQHEQKAKRIDTYNCKSK